MNITTDNTQTILNLQAELESLRAQLAAQPTPSQSELEITASNNFLAMEIVTNYLIEIDALTITHEGEGEAAGLNIVESIKKHIASQSQPTPSQSVDERAAFEKWIAENYFSIEHPNGNCDCVITTDDIRAFWQSRAQLSKPQPTSQKTIDELGEALAWAMGNLDSRYVEAHQYDELAKYQAILAKVKDKD